MRELGAARLLSWQISRNLPCEQPGCALFRTQLPLGTIVFLEVFARRPRILSYDNLGQWEFDKNAKCVTRTQHEQRRMPQVEAPRRALRAHDATFKVACPRNLKMVNYSAERELCAK